jgi:arsenate reductase
MAEALLNHLGSESFRAFSAGSLPTGEVHPLAIATLARHRVPVSNPRSKSWNEFSDTPIDLVITVCDNAASEACPVFPGAPLMAHWSLPDPAKATGPEEVIQEVFDNVFSLLKRRIEALLSLPFDEMSEKERAEALIAIGELS